MTPATTSDEIRATIDEFVRDLESLIRRAAIESVARVLHAGTHRAEPPARRTGEKRSAQHLEQLTERLLRHVADNPGQRMEQIAREVGASTRELMLPARKLLLAKRIKTRGQKRATAYFAL